MTVLSPEIRTLLAELDQKAGELKEIIEDEHSSVPEDLIIEDLLDKLDSIQDRITTIQEYQGWI